MFIRHVEVTAPSPNLLSDSKGFCFSLFFLLNFLSGSQSTKKYFFFRLHRKFLLRLQIKPPFFTFHHLTIYQSSIIPSRFALQRESKNTTKDTIIARPYFLVVEQTNILLDKGDTQTLGRLDNSAVVLAAAGGGNVLDAGAGRAEDVVDEGELKKYVMLERILLNTDTNYETSMHPEFYKMRGTKKTHKCVARYNNVAELLHPSLALLLGKGRRDIFKHSLEGLTLGTRLGKLAADEQVNGIALVRALGALLPLDAEHALVEAHPPVVGLVTRKTGAVNARLLAGAEADDLAVDGVADRVALRVLEGDGGDAEVAGGALGQGAVLGGDYCSERLGRDFDIVAVLLQVDAVDGTGLGWAGVVFGVNLKDEVLAALLLAEDLESGVLVAGGNDTVRDFLGDDAGSGDVNDVAEGNNVAKAAHAISTTGASVGLSQSRGLNALDIVDHVDLALILGERNANGCTSRRDVLEASSSRLAEGLLQLLDQGPSVESIKQVDVARRAAQCLERQLGVVGESSSRLLMRVGAISQGEVLVAVTGVLLAEKVRNGSVVVGSVLKGLEGISVAARLGNFALLELLEEASVVVGVAEDGDTLVVLCGGAQQRDAANVDLLDSLGDADVDLGDGLLEGVQVADDVVDLVNVLLGKVLFVRLEIAGEDTGVNGGVERLDTTSQHLGGLGDGADVPAVEERLAIIKVSCLWETALSSSSSSKKLVALLRSYGRPHRKVEKRTQQACPPRESCAKCRPTQGCGHFAERGPWPGPAVQSCQRRRGWQSFAG